MATRRRRDLTQSERPISAIYIGKDPLQRTADPGPPLSEQTIPESPPPTTSSRVQRQLPSPPVTLDNRSTGDSASSQAGTVGRKTNLEAPVLAQSQFENNESTMPEHEDDDHDLDEDDEDNTAKLSGDLKISQSTSSMTHPGGALARVKSLAERNRELTRRLTSLSRRDTPSPSGPSNTSANSSTTPNNYQTSRLSWSSISGSETEREPASSTAVRRLESIPSIRRSLDTSRESSPPRTPSPPPVSSRQRLISAPPSPGQSHTTPANSSSSIKSTTVRRRTSLDLSTQDSASRTFSRSTARIARPSAPETDPKEDIPATTIGRNSPLSSGRRHRHPLPHEFRDSSHSDRLSVSDLQSSTSLSSGRSGRSSPGSHISRTHSSAASSTLEPPTPRTPRTYRPASRSATVREGRQSLYHQRVESEQSASRISDDTGTSGRRASLRGGSADSIIGQRSVVSESLRAAGLARERDDDVFSSTQSGRQGSRRRLSGDLGARPQLSQVDEHSDPKERRRSTQNLDRYESTSRQRFAARPSTSLSLFQPSERSPRSQPLSRQKSAYLPERERTSPMVTGGRQAEYSGSSRNVYTPPTPSHRKTGRNSSLRILDKTSLSPASDHAKLMLDSLSMFESHLARLPTTSNASLSATTIPDLYHNAQNVVQAANTLNILLREANTHALDEQIEAEIREGNDDVGVSEIWRSIGSEYRESLRVSDELIRTMTGFLLGMGKILREATTIREAHVEEEGRVNSPIGSHGSGGRRSTDGRRSLDFPPIETSPRERERYREESLRRIATQSSARAPSVLDAFRQMGSDDERGGDSTERPSKSAISGLSVRKMFSVKTGRPKSSPADGSGPRTSLDEYGSIRTPVAAPPPLETLPSESLLQRSPSNRAARRRKGTITSASSAVRTNFPSFFSSSQPTTALTPTTVTNSPEKRAFPLQRTISTTSNVAFAKTNETAVNGLQRRFDTDTRMRSSSTSSSLDNERMAAVISPTEQGEERVFRASFDGPSGSGVSTVQKRTYADRKDRRRTVTEVFSRAN